MVVHSDPKINLLHLIRTFLTVYIVFKVYHSYILRWISPNYILTGMSRLLLKCLKNEEKDLGT